jgi:hypothetical protein
MITLVLSTVAHAIVNYTELTLQETAEFSSVKKPKLTEEAFFHWLHLIFRRSVADGNY